MYRNVYSDNSRSNAQHAWYKKTNSSSMGQNKLLEKWENLRVDYRHQFDWFKQIIGLGIVITSTILMVLNERKAVESSQSYYEGLRLVRLITNPNEISPENEGKLVHISGYLDIPELLEDFPYGVSVYAVKLKRRIQMYQWDEDKVPTADDFGQPQYQYKKTWRDRLVDSRKFVHPEKHENPRHMPVRSEVRINEVVQLGAFKLGRELKEKFNDYTQFTSGERPDSSNVKMHMGLYYHANDIWNPSVGDLRVQFSFAGPADSFVSVIAKQSGQRLLPFHLNSGQSILYLHEGNKNHFDIFSKEHFSLLFYVWVFRTSAWAAMVVGTFLASKTILIMNRRNQIIKNLIQLEPLKMSLVLTSSIAFMAMGGVWYHYTPFFGFLLMTLACCVFLYYAVFPGTTTNTIPNKSSCPPILIGTMMTWT